MHKSFSQIILSEVYKECSGLFEADKPRFFSLFEEYINVAEFIPLSFYNAFYRKFGRKRRYSLTGFLSALIVQKVFSIPTDALLIIFLEHSKELRDFCGFAKVPDASKFTRFKQTFADQLETMFECLVDFTEPICHKINDKLASIISFDTSGIEAYVTENNPKFLNKRIKNLKSRYKNNKDIDVYRLAYGTMPNSAATNDDIKKFYINGHFCYAYKFGIVTNALGIVRHISFLDKDFIKNHPTDTFSKKDNLPEEDKVIGDSTALQPILKDFFKRHNHFFYETFLGDSAFDAVDHYPFLLKDCGFKKAVIPINPRNTTNLPKAGLNELGYPLCPLDSSLQLKRIGISCGKNRAQRIKWICPKASQIERKWVCHCKNPCTCSCCGRIIYTYDNDCRNFPGIQRDTEIWNSLYKLRGTVEQCLNHFKNSMSVGLRKTQNAATLKSDLFLAGITQLFTVLLAFSMDKPKFIRSLKPLLA